MERTNALHGVVEDLFVSLWCVHLCESVDDREVLLASIGEVEV
jgi:hypothetical protein